MVPDTLFFSLFKKETTNLQSKLSKHEIKRISFTLESFLDYQHYFTQKSHCLEPQGSHLPFSKHFLGKQGQEAAPFLPKLFLLQMNRFEVVVSANFHYRHHHTHESDEVGFKLLW